MKANICLDGKLVHSVLAKNGETLEELFARAYNSVTITVVSDKGVPLKKEPDA